MAEGDTERDKEPEESGLVQAETGRSDTSISVDAIVTPPEIVAIPDVLNVTWKV